MAYLQKCVDTHGASEEELAQAWDALPLEQRRRIFNCAASQDDFDEMEEVIDMELGYLSERCSHATLQGVVTRLGVLLGIVVV